MSTEKPKGLKEKNNSIQLTKDMKKKNIPSSIAFLAALTSNCNIIEKNYIQIIYKTFKHVEKKSNKEAS